MIIKYYIPPEQDYEDRGLELYKESQLEVCNADFDESSSDESDLGPPIEVQPLFHERDISQLSYGMMSKANRNFERILDLVAVV